MKLEKNVDKNVENFKNELKNNESFITRTFQKDNKRFAILYLDGMSDKTAINEFIIAPIMRFPYPLDSSLDFIIENVITYSEVSKIKSYDNALSNILNGDSILIVDGIDEVLSLGTKKWSKRAITEPPTSTILRGPREGFTEDIQENMVMIRRKIRSKDLIFETMTIGKYSNTNVSIVYISSIADENIVTKIKKRLSDIDIDGILDSSYLKQFLKSRRTSIFKQIGETEKPDVLSSKILEGRIAIIVDGSPLVLTLPYVLFEDFQSASDYYSVPFHAAFIRILRLIAIFFAVLSPAIFVSAQLFHIQLIPLRFLLTIADSIKNTPLSPSLEMLFTLLIFEILNEASVRMPRYVGMALSVVGALVLGDTAVRAGIVSTPTIMIMALSGISMYTVPDSENTFSILRLMFLILGGSLGMFGIAVSFIGLITYMVSIDNYNTPYFAPYAPNIRNDLADGLIKSPSTITSRRPYSIPNINKTRLVRKQEKEENDEN